MAWCRTCTKPLPESITIQFTEAYIGLSVSIYKWILSTRFTLNTEYYWTIYSDHNWWWHSNPWPSNGTKTRRSFQWYHLKLHCCVNIWRKHDYFGIFICVKLMFDDVRLLATAIWSKTCMCKLINPYIYNILIIPSKSIVSSHYTSTGPFY